MELKDRNDNLYEQEAELGGKVIVRTFKFEDEKEKIIEGFTEIPEVMRFSIFKEVWTPENGLASYDMYNNKKEVKVYAAITKEGLKITLPKKMTGMLVINVERKKSNLKEL